MMLEPSWPNPWCLEESCGLMGVSFDYVREMRFLVVKDPVIEVGEEEWNSRKRIKFQILLDKKKPGGILCPGPFFLFFCSEMMIPICCLEV